MTATETASEYTTFSVDAAIKAMPEADKKALRGWYWYDWANQAYALTVMTVIAPALMAGLYNKATGTQSGDAFYAFILTGSMLLVVLTAPALGVIADRMPIKKKLLKWYTVAGVLFTALMGAAPYFGSQGYIILALMFAIGTVGFTGGNVIYYSFMPYLAEKRCMDHVSSRGYAYGFMGGSLLLIFHLIILMGPFGWDTNFRLAAIFVTSALWWWGFGMLMFKWTPEPEILPLWNGKGLAMQQRWHMGKFSDLQGNQEVQGFSTLPRCLPLVLRRCQHHRKYGKCIWRIRIRLDPSMNILLLLTVNVVAIPMTLLFGKLANVKGTKFALMLSLLIYCGVAVVAAGFAPLELESDVTAADSDYDFTFEWDNATENYTMTTLYDRGYEGWIGETSAGDKEFRDSFQEHFPTPDYSAEDAGASTIGTGLLVCLFILVMLGLLGGAMVYIQGMELGFKGAVLIIFVVLIGLVGGSMLAEKASDSEDDIKSINAEDAAAIVAGFEGAKTTDSRLSLSMVPKMVKQKLVLSTQPWWTKVVPLMVMQTLCETRFGPHSVLQYHFNGSSLDCLLVLQWVQQELKHVRCSPCSFQKHGHRNSLDSLASSANLRL